MATTEPIYLTINDKPDTIIKGMDDLVAKREGARQLALRRKRLPRILFLAGLPFIAIDLVLYFTGYRVCLFTFVTIAAWVTSLVMHLSWRRQQFPDYPPLFNETRHVIFTLRDDLAPRRNFFGHLDLTGSEKPEKVAREATNALGLATQYYRDEWLSLKTKLYDGNMLRLSAIRRLKMRTGYWKRGSISGKSKWKPPKYKGDSQELKVRISVNQEVYDSLETRSLPAGTRLGPYTVLRANYAGGIVDLAASTTAKEISSGDVLSVLQGAYGLLKRRATS